MGIGAKDYIDKLLVDKYSSSQVDNHEENALISRVDADTMMDAMNAAGQYCMGMMSIRTHLTTVCYCINAKNAIYVPLDDVAA